jgi:hypothetical protein
MPQMDHGDLVALVAGQLLAPSKRSKKDIEKAVTDAVQIVAAAREATKVEHEPPATAGSEVRLGVPPISTSHPGV